MRQQINLYREELIDRPEPFQSRQSLLLLLIAFCCLVLLGIFSYWQTSSVQAQVTLLKQQQQQLETHISDLEKKYPAPQKSASLEKKIIQRERELQGQRRAIDYFLKQDRQGRNMEILSSLEGLARYPLTGVWLRRVSLLQRGGEVKLAGSSLSPEKIPEYLQLLGEKNIFGGQVFARLKLNRLEDKGNRVDFELDSIMEETP